MKELAERTLDSSGSGIKSAGDKVADGFKKSWTCVTSLFQKCD